jgi:hypothetical protein
MIRDNSHSPVTTETNKEKRQRSPAFIGGLCAVAAAFLPLANPVLFFLGSLPLLLAAFVLAIVSIVRGKVVGGVCLLAGLVLAFTMSVVSIVSRAELLHPPTRNQIQTTSNEQIHTTPNEQIYRKRSNVFRLTKSVSIATPNGNLALPVGSELLFTSRDGDNVRFRYLGADYEIHVSATDLK